MFSESSWERLRLYSGSDVPPISCWWRHWWWEFQAAGLSQRLAKAYNVVCYEAFSGADTPTRFPSDFGQCRRQALSPWLPGKENRNLLPVLVGIFCALKQALFCLLVSMWCRWSCNFETVFGVRWSGTLNRLMNLGCRNSHWLAKFRSGEARNLLDAQCPDMDSWVPGLGLMSD